MYKRRKKTNKTSYLYLKCVVFSLFFAPRLFPVTTDTVRAKEPVSFSSRPCIHWREGLREGGGEGGREECKSQQSRKSWRNQWRTEIERNPFPTWNLTCTSGWHLFSFFFFFFDILSSSVTDDVSLGLSPLLLQVCLLSLFIGSVSVCGALAGGCFCWSNTFWSKLNYSKRRILWKESNVHVPRLTIQ